MKTYLVDVKHETITPVVIEAVTKQEAIELVLQQHGVAGDSSPGITEVLAVRCLDE